MVGFSQKQHRRDLKDIRGSVPPVGIDSGGTVHAIKVDDQGRILGNIISGEVIATLGTLSVVKSGTLDVVKNPRKDSFGTIATNSYVTGADEKIGTFPVKNIDGFTVGFNTDGTIKVEHELQLTPGGSWFTNGSDTVVPGDLVVSINHKARNYRPSTTNRDASSTVTVNVEGLGN